MVQVTFRQVKDSGSLGYPCVSSINWLVKLRIMAVLTGKDIELDAILFKPYPTTGWVHMLVPLLWCDTVTVLIINFESCGKSPSIILTKKINPRERSHHNRQSRRFLSFWYSTYKLVSENHIFYYPSKSNRIFQMTELDSSAAMLLRLPDDSAWLSDCTVTFLVCSLKFDLTNLFTEDWLDVFDSDLTTWACLSYPGIKTAKSGTSLVQTSANASHIIVQNFLQMLREEFMWKSTMSSYSHACQLSDIICTATVPLCPMLTWSQSSMLYNHLLKAGFLRWG